MKIPTVRKPESVSQSTPAEPPLDLEITHTIEEKLQAYALQGKSYGLHGRSKAGLYTIIWMWIIATLVFAARAAEDIKAEGAYDFVRGFEIVAILPGLFILIVVTIGILIWPRIEPGRRRKRSLAHLASQGQLAPVRMRLHFDGHGITMAEESGEVRLLPWHERFVLTEDDTWFSFHAPMTELNLVIAKRDLSAEEQARVRRWNDVRQTAGQPAEPALNQDLAGEELFRSREFTLDKDDQIAMMIEVASTPHWRRHHLKGHMRLAACIALAMPVFHVLGWLFDPDRLPVSIAWPLFLEMFTTRFWIPALIGLVFLAVVLFLQPALRRFGARTYAAELPASYYTEGIVIFGDKGVWDSSLCYLPWHAIRQLTINQDHFLITNRIGTVFAYPKRIFPADTIADIETLLRDRAGKPLQKEVPE